MVKDKLSLSHRFFSLVFLHCNQQGSSPAPASALSEWLFKRYWTKLTLFKSYHVWVTNNLSCILTSRGFGFSKHLELSSPQLSRARRWYSHFAERTEVGWFPTPLSFPPRARSGTECGALHRTENKPRRMLRSSVRPTLTGLPCWDWRITSPSEKGSIHRALSLIHHGTPGCACHCLLLFHACCFWFVGCAGFMQAYLILGGKTTDAGDLSRLPNLFSDELTAQHASFLYHCVGLLTA